MRRKGKKEEREGGRERKGESEIRTGESEKQKETLRARQREREEDCDGGETRGQRGRDRQAQRRACCRPGRRDISPLPSQSQPHKNELCSRLAPQLCRVLKNRPPLPRLREKAGEQEEEAGAPGKPAFFEDSLKPTFRPSNHLAILVSLSWLKESRRMLLISIDDLRPLLLHARSVQCRPARRRMPGGPTLVLPWFLLFALASGQTEDEKPTAYPVFTRRPFIVAWNAPTQDCRPRFKVQLDFSLFDLHASPNEGFVDQNLTIFYRERLGLYPFYSDQREPINGGVPQNSSLMEHLDRLQSGIDQYIRTLDKDGLAVIDWEDWRPIWVRNWQTKDIYRKASRQLVRERHPDWKDEMAEKIAIFEFETSAQAFMVETLRKAKNYRPRQLWGYYLFPDCYNHDYSNNANSYTGRCPDVEESRNDKLAWLWSESTALYPSVYLDRALASSENGRKFVRARVNEAMRISNKHHSDYSLPVFVYTRPTYNRGLDLLSEKDLVSTIGESAALGAAGAIFWGDANYTRNKETCGQIKDYLDGDLGHYIVNVTTAAELCSTVLCHGNGRCLRQNNHTNAYLHLNSASFHIQRQGKNSRLEAVGQLSAADREQFRTQFRCQCYIRWYGGSCGNVRGGHNGAAGWGTANVITLLALTTLAFLC